MLLSKMHHQNFNYTMVEKYYDTLEEEFALRADNIFRYERNLWHDSGGNYTPKERKAILTLAEMTEKFYWSNHFTKYDLPPHMIADGNHIKNQHQYLLRLQNQATKNDEFPIPQFFINSKQVIDYNICEEYTPNFSDKDAFSLFLAFKLRHLSLYDIHHCLTYYQQECGSAFLPFYKYSFDEHKYLFDENKKKVISDWITKEEQKDSSTETDNKLTEMASTENKNSKAYNHAEWTILLHFFLEHLGVDSKLHKSDVMKFLHIISQTPFTSFNNSNFKNKVDKAPSVVTSEKKVIEYLEKVGKIFEENKLDKVKLLVDETLLKEYKSEKEK